MIAESDWAQEDKDEEYEKVLDMGIDDRTGHTMDALSRATDMLYEMGDIVAFEDFSEWMTIEMLKKKLKQVWS